jgi:hypothetical protein
MNTAGASTSRPAAIASHSGLVVPFTAAPPATATASPPLLAIARAVTVYSGAAPVTLRIVTGRATAAPSNAKDSTALGGARPPAAYVNPAALEANPSAILDELSASARSAGRSVKASETRGTPRSAIVRSSPPVGVRVPLAALTTKSQLEVVLLAAAGAAVGEAVGEEAAAAQPSPSHIAAPIPIPTPMLAAASVAARTARRGALILVSERRARSSGGAEPWRCWGRCREPKTVTTRGERALWCP